MSQVIHYLSLAGIPASGVLQVETAVVVGTITTAGVYGTYRGARPGVLCADTTNGKPYQNYGTTALPVWTAL